MAGFLSPLELEYIDGRNWKITAPFEYAVGAATSKLIITIPAGFITDFASIPRIFWNILPPTGKYGKAAVVHDLLYREPRLLVKGQWRPIVRKTADCILLEAMTVLGVDWFQKDIIYYGVRLGGWLTWWKYRTTKGV